MALAKNDVYARIELEQVTVQNVTPCLLFLILPIAFSLALYTYMHLHNSEAAISPIFYLMAIVQLKTFALVFFLTVTFALVLCSSKHRKKRPNQKFIQSDVQDLILFEYRHVSILHVYEQWKMRS
jgi:hypothetical protein